MKLLFFKVNYRKSKLNNHKESSSGNGRKFSIERILFLSFILVFTAMVVVQTIMLSPTGNMIVSGNGFEGTPLGMEESLYSEGEIGLALENAVANNDLKILVNGDEVAVFNGKLVNLRVKDGDIIEIDGSSLKNDALVTIISKSENVNTNLFNKKIKISSGVKRLTQVRIN